MSDLTDDQVLAQLQAMAGTAPVPEEKHNAHTFLHAVATSDDTTKTGFLKEEEVGIPKLSIRTLKELGLYSKVVALDDDWSDYFDKRSEILTSTSLSKDAKLIELAVVQRREVANTTKRPKENKGWFRPRRSSSEV